MSQLTTSAQVDLPVSKYDQSFGTVVTSSAFLPRLQLFGGNSQLCKEGKIQMGHYGIVRAKDTVEPLGASVDVFIAAWRPKAMRIEDGNVISVYNPENPLFTNIAAAADTADSGCMFGPEFLIWVPGANPACFTTFFMASKTARRASPDVKALIGFAGTLRSTLIKAKKYSWHGDTCVKCSTPVSLPAQEDLLAETNKFVNPPEKEAELAPSEGERQR